MEASDEAEKSPLAGYQSIPLPTPLSRWGQILLLIRRNVFSLTCLAALILLGALLLHADALISPFQENGTHAEPLPDQVHTSTALPAPPQASLQTLSVTTMPGQATVHINGDSVGVSPIWDHPMAEGSHRISITKPNYTDVDTVVVLNGASAILYLALRENRQDVPTEDTLEASLTDPVAEIDRETRLLQEDAAEGPPDERTRETVEAPSSETAATDEAPPASVAAPVATNRVTEETPTGETSELPAKEPTGMLEITSEPAGATAWLDDRPIGATPATVAEVPTGSHRLRLTKEGYRDVSMEIQVAPEATSRVSEQLVALMGTLKVLVHPWGTVYIDGRLHKRESTTWYTVQLPAGAHRVQVVHPTLGRWEQVVDVAANEDNAVVVDFNKRGDTPQ